MSNMPPHELPIPPILTRQQSSISRHRKRSLSCQLSKSQQEALGRLRINMGKRQPFASEATSKSKVIPKSLILMVYCLAEFKANLALSMRTGLGVLVSSAFVVKANSENPNKVWTCFPEWYILGGISFIAVACVFGGGRNVGGTMREMFQQKMGIFMAFMFNAVLIWCFQPRLFNNQQEVDGAISDGSLMLITTSFGGKPYFVYNHDFFIVLPFMMAFNAFILIFPFEPGTKRFAMVNNLYFALTVVSPNEFSDSTKLKNATNGLYTSSNLVNNLFIYMCLGLIGSFLAFLAIWVPYPIFAIRGLQAQTRSTADTIQDLLHTIIGLYCFKKKDVEHMHLLKLKLKRKFELATLKKDKMNALLNDAWWEQCLGLAYLLGFQKTVTQQYISLYGSLLDNLRAMNQAIHQEHHERLHIPFINLIKNQVLGVEFQAMNLLKEISKEVHQGHTKLSLQSITEVEHQIEHLLKCFQMAQHNIYSTMHPTTLDVEGNMPVNLFIFSLQSFCTTMIDFQAKINRDTHATGPRICNFFKRSIKAFFDPVKYTTTKLQTAFKVWLCLLFASILSVYVFGYSSIAATTIAYIMGNQLGGSFGISLNRAVGVVAGVIMPSVALFFVCAYTSSYTEMVIFRDIFLFIWITMSTYIKWKGGLDWYAGFVSAFIASGVMLPDDICPDPSSLSSYANLVQMSLGVLLIVAIELIFWPESAFILLRKSIQKQLSLLQHSFTTLVEQNLSTDGAMNPNTLESIRRIVEIQAPAMLAEQKTLLQEALFEPRLWRPAFSRPKYEKIVDICQRLLNNTLILYKLVVWFQYRRAHISFQQSTQWAFSTEELVLTIHDTFNTLQDIFGDKFDYADADQTALFVQMKEAFCAADKDGSGQLDTAEVHSMLQRVFEASGTLPIDTIETYVNEFMEIVNRDQTGKVNFNEFVQALENGLLLEVELVHQDSQHSRVISTIQEATVDMNPLLSPYTTQLNDFEANLPLGRSHDILDVECFSLLEATKAMRKEYASWFLEDDRFENMAMEELLLLNSLMSGVSGIARNLSLIEETTMQP
ncbi:transmembrane protein [Thraustotheca clavata]|uniref:Transmembrane protein n=1 Tax=Thraustotheca clavata TaxID=74557 RepID=A0A1W0AAP2_9STRA|nr:transmembrane protein [Thraustotheca clavata]